MQTKITIVSTNVAAVFISFYYYGWWKLRCSLLPQALPFVRAAWGRINLTGARHLSHFFITVKPNQTFSDCIRYDAYNVPLLDVKTFMKPVDCSRILCKELQIGFGALLVPLVFSTFWRVVWQQFQEGPMYSDTHRYWHMLDNTWTVSINQSW